MLADHCPFNERIAEGIQRYPIQRPFSTVLRHTELFRIYGVRLPLVVTEWLSVPSFHPPAVIPQLPMMSHITQFPSVASLFDPRPPNLGMVSIRSNERDETSGLKRRRFSSYSTSALV